MQHSTLSIVPPPPRNGYSEGRTHLASRHPWLAYYEELVASISQPLDGKGEVPFAIGITSCGRGAGVSTVAANLAAAAHVLHDKVLLVDANVVHPSLDRSMAVPRSPGLCECIGELAGLQDCLYQSALAHVRVMPAGILRQGTGTVSLAASFESLLGSLRSEFGLVLIDLPPAEEQGGCLSLAGQLDGVLLVVPAERATSLEAARSVERLERRGARMLGAVLNGRREYVPAWLRRRL